MLEIGKTIVSLDLITSHFTCDLQTCKGACCVSGDSGAPLEPDEAEILGDIFHVLRPYLSEKSVKSIEEQGTSVIDIERDTVTPLIDGKECSFCIVENGINFCAIEKAWFDKKIDFRKPISCHLYPIRVKKYSSFTGLNYDKWEICKPARNLGTQKGLPVFRYLKEPLIRAFGEDFYAQVEEAAKLLEENKKESTSSK